MNETIKSKIKAKNILYKNIFRMEDWKVTFLENLITKLKGYLCYKTITSQNVSSEAQIKNFFIS